MTVYGMHTSFYTKPSNNQRLSHAFADQSQQHQQHHGQASIGELSEPKMFGRSDDLNVKMCANPFLCRRKSADVGQPGTNGLKFQPNKFPTLPPFHIVRKHCAQTWMDFMSGHPETGDGGML